MVKLKSDFPNMALGEARGCLGGLKLDEIDAANSFPMLLRARNGFEWPVKTHKKSYIYIYIYICVYIYIYIYRYRYNMYIRLLQMRSLPWLKFIGRCSRFRTI